MTRNASETATPAGGSLGFHAYMIAGAVLGGVAIGAIIYFVVRRKMTQKPTAGRLLL